MKKLYTLLIFLFTCNLAFSQSEAEKFKKQELAGKGLLQSEFKGQFSKYDFSKLWTQTENESVFGFIGDNYQRIRMKFITVTKDTSSGDTYLVYGKSMVKNNIDYFHGTLKISYIRKSKTQDFGVDNELKNKGLKGQFTIIGEFKLLEDSAQSHSGAFAGVFETNFYLDKNSKAHYDDISNYSDGYNNNQFVGEWRDYKTKITKRCNWGDYRVPNSGRWDIGAGEFSPSKGDGWETIQQQWNSKDKKIQAKAIATEKAKWWQ